MNKYELATLFREQLDAYLAEWREFLRFESISADPAYRPACERCAEWVRAALERIGFCAELLPTPGLPLVWGELRGDPALPTILIYGHYDVQPPEPLDRWTTPPFEPQIRNNRMWARGAEDNKGQLFFIVKALEALQQRGLIKNTIRVLIEGEEESRSLGLHKTLSTYRDRCAAEILLVSDTGVPSLDQGYLCAGLRGSATIEYVLHGPNRDLHSGVFGGLVRNPAVELSRIIASCFDDSGRVALPGFYDEVEEPSESVRALAEEGFGLSEEQIAAMLGTPALGGERGRGPGERRGLRPTLEVNGLYSGYTGPGGKTIIPSLAGVKFSLRLVPNQDGARCVDALTAQVISRVPEGMRLEILNRDTGGGTLRVNPNGQFVAVARRVLEELHGSSPRLLWEGGSVPILAELAAASGAEPLLVGYGMERDNIHSPDENFGLDQAELGFVYTGLLLQELGKDELRSA